MKKIIIQISGLLFFFVAFPNLNNSGANALENFNFSNHEQPAFLASDTAWADSVFQSLNLEEKIAQLLMIPAYSNKDEQYEKNLLGLVKKYKVGGIIAFQGGPARQVNLLNKLQNESEVPLLVSIDAEWGLSMRLDSCIEYPRQMALGAIQNNAFLYQMGYDIGEQLRRTGVHMSFAPVADINNNPKNPVINSRSFGEDRVNVAEKVLMYAKGLEDAGVIAVLKHFPGHGDTKTDSHYGLPVLPFSKSRLDSLELYPFQYAIKKGVPGIMSAHLYVPALDSSVHVPSSVSGKIVSGCLKDQLGFRGLAITDALGMKGLSSSVEPGEAALLAFKAGNDILLMPSAIGKTIHQIKKEIKKGRISQAQLDNSVRKILHAKAWLKLNETKTVSSDSVREDVNSPFYSSEKNKLVRNTITLLKNHGNVIPLMNPEFYRTATITIGSGEEDDFASEVSKYVQADHFYINKQDFIGADDSIYENIKKYNNLIISIQRTSQWPERNYGIYPQTNSFLQHLEFNGNMILVLFGNPYSFYRIKGLEKFHSIVLAYEDNSLIHRLTAQGIFGAFDINGKLPVSLEPLFPIHQGLFSGEIQRLSYTIPEEAEMSSRKLMKIDSIVEEAIRIKAAPGCQVLVARKNKVVFHKAYGWHSYQRKKKVQPDDIYDLASVTKITATLPALMLLESQGKISTEDSLGKYLDLPDTCNKKSLLIRDILSHQSGLTAWIPFYLKTLEPLDTSESLISSVFSWRHPLKLGAGIYANRNLMYKDSLFETEYSEEYPVLVAEKLYLHKSYRDTIYQSVYNSELGSEEYRYSDLGFLLFQSMIEQQTGNFLFPYVYHNFYSKIGAYTLGYLPLNRFPREKIVPTENDIVFRRQVLQGHVHDPGAAMLGGVAGHAGLFSNSNDLAKMMQMYLNKGVYGGRRFLPGDIINKYTRRAYPESDNRRALGFDKRDMENEETGSACKYASPDSYGHTGFTGTMVWVDPEYQLVYVFLSNRIHPNQFNTTLIEENIRTRIQEAVYESMTDVDLKTQEKN